MAATTDHEKYLPKSVSSLENPQTDIPRIAKNGRLVCVVGDVCLSRKKNAGRHTVVPLHASIQERCRKIGYDNLAPIIWYKIANATFEASGNGAEFLGKPYEPNAVIKNDIEFLTNPIEQLLKLELRKSQHTPARSRPAELSMKFSARKGFETKPTLIQTEGMTQELRNSLWNLLQFYVWNGFDERALKDFSARLWFNFFKEPVDTIPDYEIPILMKIRSRFFGCEWHKVYDFLEYILGDLSNQLLNNAVNVVLEKELAGYRYVGTLFTDITGEEEVSMLSEAIANQDFPAVTSHLETALRLLSHRESPDYRNSIKESISAVESMAQAMTGKKNTTLGNALKIIEKEGRLHSSLKEGFSKLYGYTSSEDGIRHAMLEEPNLSPADAKFFLLSCTAFINRLKAKI